MYNGISYINKEEESQLRTKLNSSISFYMETSEHEDSIGQQIQNIEERLMCKKIDEEITLTDVNVKYVTSSKFLHALHKRLKLKYKYVSITQTENDIIIKKVRREDHESQNCDVNVNEKILRMSLGFTKVFRLLVEYGKPLIGHNLLTDLMIMFRHFERSLPKSYYSFKREINSMFPNIYDTKLLTYGVNRVLVQQSLWKYNSLNMLYDYFKNGHGRHVALNSPHIEQKTATSREQFHDAGWDSYCTGYIFLRMAHILTSNKNEDDCRNFMCQELFGTAEPFKNQLNIIRCTVSHIVR